MKAKLPHAPGARRGTTLSEMCIVIALLAIVSTMIASFSAIVDKFVSQEKSQYAFLEEAAALRRDAIRWLSELDTADTQLAVSDTEITAGSEAAFCFRQGEAALQMTRRDGTQTQRALQTVTDLRFDIFPVSGAKAIVKCTVTGADDYGIRSFSQSFLLTVQCAAFTEGGAHA